MSCCQQKENKKKKIKQRTHLEWSSGRYNRVMGHKLGPFNSSRANNHAQGLEWLEPPNVSCRLSLLPAFVAYGGPPCQLLEIIWKRPSVRPFDRGRPGGSQSWPHDGKVSGPRQQPHVFPILAGHETCPLSRFGVSGVAELPFPFPCETKLSWAILGISPVAGDKGSSVLFASLYSVRLLYYVLRSTSAQSPEWREDTR